MKNKFLYENWLDKDGNPAGGVSFGSGFTISWQNGPLGRGNDRKEPNGAFVETVIEAVKERLTFYQTTKFNCDENYMAIQYLEKALESLQSRTKRRENDGVEGTHKGN